MSIAPMYLKRNQSQLILGDLNLSGQTTTDAAGNLFQFEAQDADATWGTPIPIDTAVQRWMTDGAAASTLGHENREISFKVIITARSSLALAAGEGALAKRAGESTTLTWVPPEGSPAAPITVFEVWTWHLEPVFDGAREQRLSRMYQVQMTAKPWVRSNALTTITPIIPPGVPTTVSVDTCASTTGWTGSPVAVTTSGGALHVSRSETGPSTINYSMTRSGVVSGMLTTPYLIIDMNVTGTFIVGAFLVKVDANFISLTAQIGTQRYYQMPAGVDSFSSLFIGVAGTVPSGTSTTVNFAVADVSRTDTIGGIGSPKQLTRHLDVGGSVKTSGSIQVSSPSTTNLGTTVVYTRPDDGGGYNPAMRQYRTSGNAVTADATCVSGNREALVTTGASAGTITFTIPPGQLPEATYVVAARVLYGASATITWTIQGTTNAVAGVNTTTLVGTTSRTSATPGWGIIGVVTLPGSKIPVGSTVSNLITVSATATTGTHTLDELYLFDVASGALSMISIPTGTGGATNVWLDAPDADPENHPVAYWGSLAGKSDAGAVNNGAITSLGDHDLDPDGTIMFTVTDNVNNANVTASFYRRWHTHAGT